MSYSHYKLEIRILFITFCLFLVHFFNDENVFQIVNSPKIRRTEYKSLV